MRPFSILRTAKIENTISYSKYIKELAFIMFS
jgi:hypothetical protein